MTDIPALVLARLELHAAETRVALETLKAKMQGEHVWPSRSKAMRAQRDRLTAELAAWEYITAHANGVAARHALAEKFPREESTTDAGLVLPAITSGVSCTLCKHAPHGSSQCIGNRNLCPCPGDSQPVARNKPCPGCNHMPHPEDICGVGGCFCGEGVS